MTFDYWSAPPRGWQKGRRTEVRLPVVANWPVTSVLFVRVRCFLYPLSHRGIGRGLFGLISVL